jgi:DNA repair protein RadA/Sms
VVEEPVAARSRVGASARAASAPALSLALADAPEELRHPTGIGEVDRVLGGGLVMGSVVLLAGEPGVGKSTLMLQVAAALGTTRDVLIVCGEESPQQIRARALRLGEVPVRVQTMTDVSLPSVLGAVEGTEGVVVVDSIQTLHDPEIASAPGSVSQVRECGAAVARVARERGVTVVFVGHVTKDGSIAGPRVLEHLVDVVCSFEGERQGGLRVLRALKNRFGSTQEAGFFEMTSDGLASIRDASRYLLQDRAPGLAGSVLAAALEGRRPIVLEMQALVTKSKVPMGRRTALGIDPQRLPLLVAVIEKRLGIALNDREIYVSAVGGIDASEPAADLPAIMAMLSSHFDKAVPADLVAFGEVGLAGEVRQVAAPERRLAEAGSVGCKRAVVPHNTDVAADGIELLRVRNLHDALQVIQRG